jgi:anti-anti-sigma factor
MCDLHLDFSELTFLDSAALSRLLMLHCRTSQAGVALHLDHRPQFLDRVLQVTGLFDTSMVAEPCARDYRET